MSTINQDTLTAARRLAHFEALERMRACRQRRLTIPPADDSDLFHEWRVAVTQRKATEASEAKRPDQLEFSLLVVAAIATVAALGAIGFAVGCVVAWVRMGRVL